MAVQLATKLPDRTQLVDEWVSDATDGVLVGMMHSYVDTMSRVKPNSLQYRDAADDVRPEDPTPENVERFRRLLTE